MQVYSIIIVTMIIRKMLISLVRLYQVTLSPLFGKNCRYVPTCSAYMIEAIQTHGSMKGAWLGLKRLSKCHPLNDRHWHKCQGHDPVPDVKEH
jgi:putative membrane protein insertion efficiency factor